MPVLRHSPPLPPVMAALCALLATGCAWTPQPAQAPVAQATPAPAPVPAPAPEAVPTPAPAPSTGGNVAGQARSFSTQHATYTAVDFDTLPGWSRDDFAESWDAFRSSCGVLSKRAAAWREVCDRAGRVDGKNNNAIRGFYEREFSVYQIRDDDRSPRGVVTGYFEPEIKGSRSYSPPFIYPVYAQPEDMLFLDARAIPAGAKGTVVGEVQGRNVTIRRGLSTREMGSAGFYTLDLTGLNRDALDRRVRLRADGRRLLPYYTRAEIETKGAPNARVIAFVDNASALYEMQVQGSGRIRLPGGEMIHVGYAEQNGQPFRPTVAKASTGRPKGVRVRGSSIELEIDDDDESDIQAGVLTRGFTLARPIKSGAVAVPGQRATAPLSGSGIQDPSYVFFREVDKKAESSVGALGVPLTAGRSIAVDPRSTPLGYPVFVSTQQPNSAKPMQRLTLAQDTGGAIRGAIRADYFFGSGPDAANSARRMKQPGQMWLLLPRGLKVAASTASGVRVRGAGLGLPECLVPDEGSCVEN
ncbi:murein transglycosylase A [Ottowia sp. VDI28]|uniref:murein transglycosylase A n=1 Tax=Ottowia sp. VDI28 TaxID=3133968 RepID=UPI003C2EA4A4